MLSADGGADADDSKKEKEGGGGGAPRGGEMEAWGSEGTGGERASLAKGVGAPPQRDSSGSEGE